MGQSTGDPIGLLLLSLGLLELENDCSDDDNEEEEADHTVPDETWIETGGGCSPEGPYALLGCVRRPARCPIVQNASYVTE